MDKKKRKAQGATKSARRPRRPKLQRFWSATRSFYLDAPKGWTENPKEELEDEEDCEFSASARLLEALNLCRQDHEGQRTVAIEELPTEACRERYWYPIVKLFAGLPENQLPPVVDSLEIAHPDGSSSSTMTIRACSNRESLDSLGIWADFFYGGWTYALSAFWPSDCDHSEALEEFRALASTLTLCWTADAPATNRYLADLLSRYGAQNEGDEQQGPPQAAE